MSGIKEIFIRIDRCTSCHTCEIACAVEHSARQEPAERHFRTN